MYLGTRSSRFRSYSCLVVCTYSIASVHISSRYDTNAKPRSGLVAAILRFIEAFRVFDINLEWFEAMTTITMWSSIETGCYLIASCLPTLRPFVMSVLKKVGSAVNRPKPTSQTSAALPLGRIRPKQKKAFMSFELGSWRGTRMTDGSQNDDSRSILPEMVPAS